jgi:hypothetical protein
MCCDGDVTGQDRDSAGGFTAALKMEGWRRLLPR